MWACLCSTKHQLGKAVPLLQALNPLLLATRCLATSCMASPAPPCYAGWGLGGRLPVALHPADRLAVQASLETGLRGQG